MQCIITQINLSKLTHYDETKIRARNTQIEPQVELWWAQRQTSGTNKPKCSCRELKKAASICNAYLIKIEPHQEKMYDSNWPAVLQGLARVWKISTQLANNKSASKTAPILKLIWVLLFLYDKI